MPPEMNPDGTYKPARNDGEARQWVRDNFGWMAYFLNDPELGGILMDAGYNRWDSGRVENAIKNTNWWRTKNDAQKQYEKLAAENPNELVIQRQKKAAIVNDAAHRLGIGNKINLAKFADDALRNGWSDEQVMDMLSWSITMDDVNKPGQVSQWFNEMKALASDYYVRVHDQDLLADAQRIARGERTVEEMRGYYIARAKEKFGYLAESLDQGTTVKQYFAPHKAEIANLLELGEESVDLMNDPRYSAVLQQSDPATGKQRAMTITEAGELARKDERWKATANSRNTTSSVIDAVTKVFGVRA